MPNQGEDHGPQNGVLEPPTASIALVDLPVQPRAADPSLLVALGASAGGLQALEEFFDAMPADSGLGFVVITHRLPGAPSLLPQLLAKHTQMPVKEVAAGLRVEPNTVYVATAHRHVSIAKGVLELLEPNGASAPQLPIDFFLRSLAKDQKERAVGIILSGTGTDGTLGITEIKGASGLTMTQEGEDASYQGMPGSAARTGLVDFQLPARQMPKQLIAYARGAHLAPRAEPLPSGSPAQQAIELIFRLLRERSGHDFSSYKSTTMRRRIERRMNLQQVDALEAYVRLLQSKPAELDLLFKDLLIGVTSFFRDPESFEALGEKVLPDLLAARPEDHLFRVWVPGCSTGEEAYSIALLFREVMERTKLYRPLQIFATDLDPAAIDIARAGLYPEGIRGDVPERLLRFFTHEEGGYRVRGEIRELLVFATQNLLRDPPFTRLDLLSCRNVLIYLETQVQQRLIPLFHYALRPGGVLFLGASESLGTSSDLFVGLDKKGKIFARREGSSVALTAADFPALPSIDRPAPLTSGQAGPTNGGLVRQCERALLDLVPPSVIIRERGDVVHIHGRTGLYLEPAPGPQGSQNIFNMARDGLQLELTSALRRAARERHEVVTRGIRVKCNGSTTRLDLRVLRLSKPGAMDGLYRLTFETQEEAPPEAGAERAAGEAGRTRLTDLEHELESARESHQGTLEELETANEELKSTNEELQSANEELQSTNEELQTSKEEMQSLNEELQTVNAELQGKIEDLSRANNDLKNFLNRTDIATVFLDNELCIKRYTVQATQVINLIPSDLGRPISDLVAKLDYGDLVKDARNVLETLAAKEREVRGAGGTWYFMRMLPYRTAENVIDGLVITFIDISKLKRAELALEAARHYREILEMVPVPVVVLDTSARVVFANPTFQERFRVDPEVLAAKVYDLAGGALDVPALRQLLEQLLPANERIDGHRVEIELPNDGRLAFSVRARRLDGPSLVVLTFGSLA